MDPQKLDMRMVKSFLQETERYQPFILDDCLLMSNENRAGVAQQDVTSLPTPTKRLQNLDWKLVGKKLCVKCKFPLEEDSIREMKGVR